MLSGYHPRGRFLPIHLIRPPAKKRNSAWSVRNPQGSAQSAVFILSFDQDVAGRLVTFELIHLIPRHNLGRFRFSVTGSESPHDLDREVKIVPLLSESASSD